MWAIQLFDVAQQLIRPADKLNMVAMVEKRLWTH
jgi:hypothetical protein